jgi:hypothetical protein
MTDADYARKLAELDRLLNDPDVPMQPAHVWSLLAEISRHDLAEGVSPHARGRSPRAPSAAPPPHLPSRAP